MPKGYCRDPETEMRRILFGTDKRPVNLTKMSKDTRIAFSTLARYKQHPSTIPLERLRRIVKWNELDAETTWEIFK